MVPRRLARLMGRSMTESHGAMRRNSQAVPNRSAAGHRQPLTRARATGANKFGVSVGARKRHRRFAGGSLKDPDTRQKLSFDVKAADRRFACRSAKHPRRRRPVTTRGQAGRARVPAEQAEGVEKLSGAHYVLPRRGESRGRVTVPFPSRPPGGRSGERRGQKPPKYSVPSHAAWVTSPVKQARGWR